MTVFDPTYQPVRNAAPGSVPANTNTAGAERMMDAQMRRDVQKSRAGNTGLAALSGGVAVGNQYMEELKREKALRETADAINADTELRLRQQDVMKRIEDLRHTGTDEEIEDEVERIIREAEDGYSSEFLAGRDEGGVPFLRGGEGNATAEIRLRSQQSWGQTRLKAQAWLADRHRKASLDRLNRAWESQLEDPDREVALRGLRGVAEQLKAAGMDPEGVEQSYREAETTLALRQIEEESLGAILASETDPEQAVEVLRATADELALTDEVLEESGDARARMLLAIPQVDRKKLAVRAKNIASSASSLQQQRQRQAEDEAEDARAAFTATKLNQLHAAMSMDGQGRRRVLTESELLHLSVDKNDQGQEVTDWEVFGMLADYQIAMGERSKKLGADEAAALSAAEQEALVDFSLALRAPVGAYVDDNDRPYLDRDRVYFDFVEKGLKGVDGQRFSPAFFDKLNAEVNASKSLSTPDKEMLARVWAPLDAHLDDGGSLFKTPEGRIATEKPLFSGYQKLSKVEVARIKARVERYKLQNPRATEEDVQAFLEERVFESEVKAMGDQVIDQLGYQGQSFGSMPIGGSR